MLLHQSNVGVVLGHVLLAGEVPIVVCYYEHACVQCLSPRTVSYGRVHIYLHAGERASSRFRLCRGGRSPSSLKV